MQKLSPRFTEIGDQTPDRLNAVISISVKGNADSWSVLPELFRGLLRECIR
jgi:hypothetical protein